MSTYRQCDNGVVATVRRLIKENHLDLDHAGVTIGCRFAYAPRNKDGEPAGPALKLHGYPCLAVANITSYGHRVDGLPDARITLNGDEWDELIEERQLAVLDHELEHFEVRRDDEGNFLLDDANRPKLKIKLHDLVVGGFAQIVHRHGRNAEEYRHVEMIYVMNADAGKHGQLLFPFMSGETGTKLVKPSMTIVTNGPGTPSQSVTFTGEDLENVAKVGKRLRKKEMEPA
jgi:hypothetical protein